MLTLTLERSAERAQPFMCLKRPSMRGVEHTRMAQETFVIVVIVVELIVIVGWINRFRCSSTLFSQQGSLLGPKACKSIGAKDPFNILS